MRFSIIIALILLIFLSLYNDIQLFDFNKNYTYKGKPLKYSKNFFTSLGYINCNKIDKKIYQSFDLELQNKKNFYRIGPFNKKIFGFFLQKNEDQYYCKNLMPVEGVFKDELELEQKRYYSFLEEIKKDF
jgi:hypothetical protein